MVTSADLDIDVGEYDCSCDNIACVSDDVCAVKVNMVQTLAGLESGE